MNKITIGTLSAVIFFGLGYVISDTGALNLTTKTAYCIKEPLIIMGEQNYRSILPVGTVLYFDRAWPEGHQTYHVYFHFKGKFKEDIADSRMISPLWLRTAEPGELLKVTKY